MISCNIIADSINPCKNRLTTFVLEYPRFIHAEVMTHRVFSRNASSSRAIPIEKMIEQVENNPAMPEFWGKNQKGMQAEEELSDIIEPDSPGLEIQPYNKSPKEQAKQIWLWQRDMAIAAAKELNKIGLHKQITNRILEPWLHIRVIVSSTDYENFFALRAHPAAQPEVKILAEKMLEAYNNSIPKELNSGEWHIPFGDKINENKLLNLKNYIPLDGNEFSTEIELIEELKKKIAIARCARVSYFNFEGKDDYEADIKLCDRLFANVPRHLSPTEHVAKALHYPDNIGNFTGWLQYRKTFIDENLLDKRVKKY